jgi:hypothetical protein
MPDVVSWVFRSPKRLALSVGVPLLVALTVITVIASRDPAGSGSGAGGATSSPSANPIGNKEATDAAVRFAAAWAQVRPGQTSAQWRGAVSALATKELAAGLAFTDVKTLPGGTPRGTPTVRFAATDSALVAVPLSSGPTVAVTVVRVDGQWKAADIQPDTGDTGDTSAGGPGAPQAQPTSGSGSGSGSDGGYGQASDGSGTGADPTRLPGQGWDWSSPSPGPQSPTPTPTRRRATPTPTHTAWS